MCPPKSNVLAEYMFDCAFHIIISIIITNSFIWGSWVCAGVPCLGEFYFVSEIEMDRPPQQIFKIIIFCIS